MSRSSCCEWLKVSKTNFFVYLSHFLSAWGDRMWSFGIGLFLINISPDSLMLTAVYGLSMGVCVLLFGALVGDIVDETPRLKAAQTSLVLQNIFVAICAGVVYLFLDFRSDIVSVGSWTTYVAYGVIIILGILSRLTSMALKIAVEKDWIVEICGKDFDMLATMTASLRRIDLTTKILAPVATGLIMSYAGVEIGAIFIGSWNLCSVFVEYYFLWKVYNTVPALRDKKDLKKSEIETAEPDNLGKPILDKHKDPLDTTNVTDVILTASEASDTKLKQDSICIDKKGEAVEEELHLDTESKSEGPNKDKDTETDEKKMKKKGRKCLLVFNSIERLYKGWPVYARYDVRYAGFALACLYMTVLGLDSVTVGYAKMQGISEGLIGIMMGVAAMIGIFGTFMYPVMRRKLGLPRTGIFGLTLEILSLTVCVVSVWMPGSPFDLTQGFSVGSEISTNCTLDSLNATNYNSTDTVAMIVGNTTTMNSSIFESPNANSTSTCPEISHLPDSPVSVWLLLIGIVFARFGLWVTDLAVTQLFMEKVLEKERGKVNGVQNALNQLMDMLKFGMVVLAPYEHQFGLLVLISFGFICMAWVSYAWFLRNNRGHFFHFQKYIGVCGSKQKPVA